MESWVKDHDNRLSFTVLYIGLSVILSVFVSIFWLLPIIILHAVIEWKSMAHASKAGLIHVFLHLKLDVVLFIFAIWISVYFESLFGLLGLNALSRSAAQGGSRFLAWQKSIKGSLLVMDDAARVLKGASLIKKSKVTGCEEPSHVVKLSLGGAFAVLIGLVMLLSIALAPYIIDIEYPELWALLLEELHPFPSKV